MAVDRDADAVEAPLGELLARLENEGCPSSALANVEAQLEAGEFASVLIDDDTTQEVTSGIRPDRRRSGSRRPPQR